VSEDKTILLEELAKDSDKPFLEQLLQEGARKLLRAAIENEVIDYIQAHRDRRDENGGARWYATAICRSGKSSLGLVRCRSVSLGCGTVKRASVLVVRSYPNTCAGPRVSIASFRCCT
jgi:hypothetical protein